MASQPDPLLGYAVHFTRGNSPAEAVKALARPLPNAPGHMELMQWLYDIDDTGYRASLRILWQGFVRPTDLPLCVGNDIAELEDAHRSACFSESPLDELARLIKTRSLYGVGFAQDFLRINRGQPVKYLQHGSAETQWWAQEIRSRCIAKVERVARPRRAQVPAGRRCVCLPARGATRQRSRVLYGAQHQQQRAAYLGRYLDPRWDRERIQEILKEPVSACVTSEPALSDPQAAESRA